MISNDQIKNILLKILELRKQKIINLYSNYISNYESNNSRGCAEYKQAIFKTNNLIEYDIYSEEEQEFIKKLGFYPYIGKIGNEKFNEIIATYSLEPNLLISSLNDRKKALSILFDKINYVNNIFEFFPKNVMTNEIKGEIEEGNGILSIHFQKGCNITGLKELSENAEIWNKLIREIYLLKGVTPLANIEFEEIKKGSVIVDLKIIIPSLMLLGKLISWSLDQRKKYLEIKLLEKELNKNGFSKELEEMIKKEIAEKIEKIEEKMAENILIKLKEEIDFTKLNSAYESEIGSLKLVIPKLIDFLEKGGELKIKTNDTTEEEKETEKLFNQVDKRLEYLESSKFLENKVK